jgi:hypothetical protein
VTKPSFRLNHAKGFEWFLASEYPGGTIEWVRQLPREIIAEAFPVTPPIAPNPRMLESYLRQRNYRELQIQHFRDLMKIPRHTGETEFLLDEFFPQNDDACENVITGRKCQFYEVCWNTQVRRDPLQFGQFKLREGSPVTQKMIQLREVKDA